MCIGLHVQLCLCCTLAFWSDESMSHWDRCSYCWLIYRTNICLSGVELAQLYHTSCEFVGNMFMGMLIQLKSNQIYDKQILGSHVYVDDSWSTWKTRPPKKNNSWSRKIVFCFFGGIERHRTWISTEHIVGWFWSMFVHLGSGSCSESCVCRHVSITLKSLFIVLWQIGSTEVGHVSFLIKNGRGLYEVGNYTTLFRCFCVVGVIVFMIIGHSCCIC